MRHRPSGVNWRCGKTEGRPPALQPSPHRADVSRPPNDQPITDYPESGCFTPGRSAARPLRGTGLSHAMSSSGTDMATGHTSSTGKKNTRAPIEAHSPSDIFSALLDMHSEGPVAMTGPSTMLYRLKVRLAGRLVRPDLSRAFRVTVYRAVASEAGDGSPVTGVDAARLGCDECREPAGVGGDAGT